MSIEKDFSPHVAARMRAELARFGDKCHYDEEQKKIVYHNDQYALEAYMTYQREEMECHKWIESEKSQCDLGRQALIDWINRYSDKFARYWRRTHLYITPAGCPETASHKKQG